MSKNLSRKVETYRSMSKSGVSGGYQPSRNHAPQATRSSVGFQGSDTQYSKAVSIKGKGKTVKKTNPRKSPSMPKAPAREKSPKGRPGYFMKQAGPR